MLMVYNKRGGWPLAIAPIGAFNPIVAKLQLSLTPASSSYSLVFMINV